jgi:hypothetical protein
MQSGNRRSFPHDQHSNKVEALRTAPRAAGRTLKGRRWRPLRLHDYRVLNVAVQWLSESDFLLPGWYKRSFAGELHTPFKSGTSEWLIVGMG